MAKNKIRVGGALTEDILTTINENFSDYAVCTTQLDVTSSTTFADIPGMTSGVLVPGVYEFIIQMGTISTANNGIKFAISHGTASMLSQIEYNANLFSAAGIGSGRGTTTTSGSAIATSASGAIVNARIAGTLTVAVAGTLTVQMAQSTSHADTASVFVGSYLKLNRIKSN